MKFSIVMPMYKQAEDVVKRAIFSIINQTYSNFELIICDNGNEHKEVIDFINNLSKEDKRIIYFKNEKNVGWPKGISLCLERASGDFMGFIADDDYLEEWALSYVYDEIEKNHPDVLWLGQKYDALKNGSFRTIGQTLSLRYKVLNGKKEICENLVRFFENVYYNSMQHYVSMKLLKKYKINFYDKYFSDCGGMTKVLCTAEKMVILNKLPYHLTKTTSRTAGYYQVGFYDMFATQWESIIELLDSEKYYDKKTMQYAAIRIEKNHLGNIKLLCSGAPCRTDLYENIDMDFSKRFLEIEKMLSNCKISEMVDFYGRESYFNIVFGDLIELFQNAQNNGVSIEEVIKDSDYLGDFMLGILDNVDGNIGIAKQIDMDRIRSIVKSLNNKNNVSLYGCEIILKNKILLDEDAQGVLQILDIEKKYELKEKSLCLRYNFNAPMDGYYHFNKWVSFICPCYNDESYIDKFVNNLLSLDIYTNKIEMIFVNDNSSDDTYSELLKYKKKYPHSILIIDLTKKINLNECIDIGKQYASSNCIVNVNIHNKIRF